VLIEAFHKKAPCSNPSGLGEGLQTRKEDKEVPKYENFFIIDPDLPDEGVASLEEKLRNVVTSSEGIVLSYVPWGKKKLAYPIKKRNRGHYILMEFAGGPQLVAELERNMRLDERVLKFIAVKLEDRFDPEKETKPQAKKPSLFEEEEVLEEAFGSSFEKMEEDEDEDFEEAFEYDEEASEEEDYKDQR
jgi:small subunit ribosomal protein S6